MSKDLSSKYFPKSKRKKSLLDKYAMPITLGLIAVKTAKSLKRKQENEQIANMLKEILKEQKKEEMKKRPFLVRIFMKIWSLLLFIIKIAFWFIVALLIFIYLTETTQI